MGPLVIIGPGILGLSLARQAVERGLEVRLVGRDHAHAAIGVRKLESSWMRALDEGSQEPDTFRIFLNRIRASSSIKEALEGSSAMMEALPEDLSLKASFWHGMGSSLPATVLPLTSSSGFSASLIRESADLGPGLINFHLFVPIHRHPVVELAAPQDTSDALLARAQELATSLGLKIVAIREALGLAASRMGLAQGLEAMRLLQDGHGTAQDLDALMTLGYGHPCGPLELSDRIGLDLRLAIADHLHRSTANPAFAPPDILKEKVANGELGRKSGRGFYPWNPDGTRS